MDKFLKKLYYPSGLMPRQHSEACDLVWERSNAQYRKCVCSLAKSVTLAKLLESKSWRGSSVEPCTHKGRAAHKVTHPSGAIAYLYVKEA